MSAEPSYNPALYIAFFVRGNAVEAESPDYLSPIWKALSHISGLPKHLLFFGVEDAAIRYNVTTYDKQALTLTSAEAARLSVYNYFLSRSLEYRPFEPDNYGEVFNLNSQKQACDVLAEKYFLNYLPDDRQVHLAVPLDDIPTVLNQLRDACIAIGANWPHALQQIHWISL